MSLFSGSKVVIVVIVGLSSFGMGMLTVVGNLLVVLDRLFTPKKVAVSHTGFPS